MRSYRSLALVFAAAALVTFLLIPVAIKLAKRVGAVVPPGDRRVHTSPTPTLGGIAMFCGLLAGIGVAATRTSFSETASDTSRCATCREMPISLAISSWVRPAM